MTHLEVFEGTWEELATHAEAFKGRKLRLIVLPVATATTAASDTDELRLHEAEARLLAEADSIEREPGTLSSDPYKAVFSEIIAEKHRKMGLQL